MNKQTKPSSVKIVTVSIHYNTGEIKRANLTKIRDAIQWLNLNDIETEVEK